MNENYIRVAVVDDDESFARAIGRLLRAAGFEVFVYSAGESFLHEFTCRSFDCLVLDIQLGGMSGLDLGRRLVESGSKIPFIFVTALEEAGPGQTARQIGCSAYFPKPVSGRLLVAAIRRAVDSCSKMTRKPQ